MTATELRDLVVQGLHGYTHRPVVLSDQIVAEVAAPYLYYQFVQELIPGNGSETLAAGSGTDDVMVTRTAQVEATLSVTACAYNSDQEDGSTRFGDDQAMALAYLARKWFNLSGYQALSDAGVVVVDVEPIAPRSALDYVDVARRHGFDVRLRYTVMDTDTRPAILHAAAREKE